MLARQQLHYVAGTCTVGSITAADDANNVSRGPLDVVNGGRVLSPEKYGPSFSAFTTSIEDLPDAAEYLADQITNMNQLVDSYFDRFSLDLNRFRCLEILSDMSSPSDDGNTCPSVAPATTVERQTYRIAFVFAWWKIFVRRIQVTRRSQRLCRLSREIIHPSE